jgi:hypothetical protein
MVHMPYPVPDHRDQPRDAVGHFFWLAAQRAGLSGKSRGQSMKGQFHAGNHCLI